MPDIISIELQCLDIYSLAAYTNGISLIDEITVKNISDYNIKNLELEITSTPAFFAPFITKISSLSHSRHIVISDLNIDIDATKLMYSRQYFPSVITVKAKNMGDTLAEYSRSIVVLPYDHIPPVSDYTELISSFVTPYQPEVKKVSQSVFEQLKSNPYVSVNRDTWNYNDKKSTREIIKAIYRTVRDLRITLDNVNIFSEGKPIKVKLPETVYATKRGNSFEIALLTASIAEELGINSFLVMTSDRCLIGFFYKQECFQTCVSDDGRGFFPLVDGDCDSFCVIDTTSMMNGTQVAFEDSMITAQKALNDCEYPTVVDIKRSRLSGYKQLPIRLTQHGSLIFELLTDGGKVTAGATATNYFDSSESMSLYVKNGLTKGDYTKQLSDIDSEKCIYLVGETRYIINKLYLNGRIEIKKFPVTDAIDVSSEPYVQLNRLNANISNQDLSETVNSFHDKGALYNRVSRMLDECNGSISKICLSLGTIGYTSNGNIMHAPLLLLPVDLISDAVSGIYIKALGNDAIVNSVISDILSKRGIPFDFTQRYSDYIEHYTDIKEELTQAFQEQVGFSFYDVVSISSLSIDSHSLSDLATPEFFSKSNVLDKLFTSQKFECSNYESADIKNTDMPFILDATQINAVHGACNNECTVIKGVNGTGKTKVAASIAFSELRKGNKVLYLSNSNSNIRDFNYLAQHSGVKDFTLDFTSVNELNNYDYLLNHKQSSKSDLDGVTQKLLELTSAQNSYYDNLHKVNEIGFSLYEAASQYERYRSFPYSVSFNYSDVSGLTRDDVVRWFDCVSSVAKAGADCKEPHANPLSYIRVKNFSYDLKSKAVILLNSHGILTKNFVNLQNSLAEFLGVEIQILKERQTSVLLDIFRCILNDYKYIHFGIFSRPSIESDFARIESLTLQCDDLFELNSYINSLFTEDVVSLDFDSLLLEWRNANSKFAFTRSSAQNTVKNKLKAYCKNPKDITNDNITEILSKLSRFKSSVTLARDNSNLVYQITGIDLKTSLDTNDTNVFNEIKKSITVSQHYLSLIADLYNSERSPDGIYHHQCNLFKKTDKLLEDISGFKHIFEEYERYLQSENEVVSLLDVDIIQAKEENEKIWYYFIQQFIDKINMNLDLLKYWCTWNVEKEKAISMGLGNVISLYEDEQISSNDLKNAFLKGFFKAVTECFLSHEPSVSNFSADVQNEGIAHIYKYMDEYRCSLSESLKDNVIGSFNRYLETSQYPSAEDAVMDLKRHFSFGISSVCDENSQRLIQNAKPCFACNSASFLTKFNKLPSFDTVIIDCNTSEFSYDIYMLLPLAKKLVIIDGNYGDLSNSFTSYLIKKGAAFYELGWLYNTNYATVVVNDLFYNNSLSAFMCSTKKKNGINLLYQISTYDRKKTRTNVIEASTVVDEIIKLRSEDPKSSIGVYTITEEQRVLIEMLLKKRIGASSTPSSDLFVRSIRNAEYDRRDIIILSTVFSGEERPKYKDSISKTIPELSNKEGIDALMNVFSSAKKSFYLATSLTADMLDKFKTTEKGYCVFKKAMLRFLTDRSTLRQNISTEALSDNSMVREAANHIESLGYKADLGVGINKCKIDIAVRSKDKSQYLLGIIFDETAYTGSENHFGRDLIVRGLEKYGKWKILRIYTVDWFENCNKQLDLISSALNGNELENDLTITNLWE